MYQTIIIGCGFAGTVVAREWAEKYGGSAIVLDSRNHVGGNCYDEKDKFGILVHKYGPHIFHTNIERVFNYLSRFTDWYDYQHEVIGNIYGEEIPIPFNLNTLEMVYGERADHLKELLIDTFGEGARVPILELRKSDNEELKEIAKYIYENIFLKYTMKQWGQKPEEIDPAVSGRVPIVISYDNRYFDDQYQGMPEDGYEQLFINMLNCKGIDVYLNCKAKDVITIREDEDNPGKKQVWFRDEPFYGNVVFTGALDEFFDCRFGRLPYRSLRFELEYYNEKFHQSHGVVNYTVSEEFTRITEYKHLTGQKKKNETTIMKEYPIEYEGKEDQIPYYAINNPDNQAVYEKYKKLADEIPNFYVLGRLAEYKYYNIDAIVDRALSFASELAFSSIGTNGGKK